MIASTHVGPAAHPRNFNIWPSLIVNPKLRSSTFSIVQLNPMDPRSKKTSANACTTGCAWPVLRNFCWLFKGEEPLRAHRAAVPPVERSGGRRRSATVLSCRRRRVGIALAYAAPVVHRPNQPRVLRRMQIRRRANQVKCALPSPRWAPKRIETLERTDWQCAAAGHDPVRNRLAGNLAVRRRDLDNAIVPPGPPSPPVREGRSVAPLR